MLIGGTSRSTGRRIRRPAGVLPLSWSVPAFALVLGVIAYALWPVGAVQLELNGETVKIMPVPRGAELYLDYHHSVARVPVREVFIMPARGGFLLIRTEHGAFGAGLPTENFGEFRREGDVYINSGIEQPLALIPLRVSTGSEQTLTIQGGSDLSFLDVFNANNLVTIRPRTLPRAAYIIRRKRFS